jgi:hypothetical protein
VTVSPPAVRSRVSCWKTFIVAAIVREPLPDVEEERIYPQRILRYHPPCELVPVGPR